VNTAQGIGVYGSSHDGVGVWGASRNREGVYAESHSATIAAIAAFMMNRDGVGAALHAENRGHGAGVFAKGERLAALFVGDVEVQGSIRATGNITLLNADCAEEFNVSAEASVEPGTVMALDDEGNLRESCHGYDKRVAGVICGAGSYKPGLVLDKQQEPGNRQPIALLGKVHCKADASYGPIQVGDLLTTSDTPGHAMKAADPLKAFGAVIGKALCPLTHGQGLIPILVALR
jgi:hypothetical protein